MYKPLKKSSNYINKIFTIIILFFCAFVLTACQSTDKNKTYMKRGDDFKYSCTYNADRGETKIVVETIITNDTIYVINQEILVVNAYKNDVLVEEDVRIPNNLKIKNGDTTQIIFEKYNTGDIDKVEFVKWYVDFDNLWNSYLVWFIASIVLASVLALCVIIISIISDLEIDDIFEFVEDHTWIIFIFGIGYLSYIIDGFSSGRWSWVPLIIISCAIIACIVIILLFFLIKYIIEEGDFSVLHGYNKLVEQPMEESLRAFTKSELLAYCSERGLSGYSKLNKDELIEFIISNENNEGIKPNKEIKSTKVTNKKTSITFDDIAGLEEAKQAFNEKVIMPIKHKDLYESFGKKVGGGILLYGLPGTGKTMFAEAASNELDALFIPIKCSDIKSKWYGESEQKVKEIFNKARKAKCAIIFFDEFEAIGAKRTDNSDNGNNDLVPEILANMQGVATSSSNSILLVIAATNKPWAIDSAFLRPGRFDEKIYIPLPDYEARRKIFELQLSKYPHEESLDYDLLAKMTDGCNGADIKEICEKLKLSAIKDSISSGKQETIGMDDIERIKDSIKSSVQLDDINKLKEFQNNWK